MELLLLLMSLGRSCQRFLSALLCDGKRFEPGFALGGFELDLREELGWVIGNLKGWAQIWNFGTQTDLK